MKRILLLCFFGIICVRIRAQDPSLLHTLRQDSTIEMHLTLDWRTVEKEKKEKAYHPCGVKVIRARHDTLSMPGKARPRGHMRLDVCSFPPLKLKFDKGELARHHLSGLNEMDLVYPCHTGESYEQLLLREYLAYRIWEILSPYHFKTQLVRLHYNHEDGTTAYDPTSAILVENTEEVVDRLGGRRNKTPVISQNAVDRQPMLVVALFQFMIGNTDWFILNRHNLEFVGIPGHRLLVPIPYDFDYSGLVLAPYAAPHTSLDLPAVTIRYYQGWCYTQEEVMNALQVFFDNKEKILALPYTIPGLNERSIKYTTTYLREFYDIIETPQKLKNQILRHCDMWPVRE